jgi:hypothetical protein
MNQHGDRIRSMPSPIPGEHCRRRPSMSEVAAYMNGEYDPKAYVNGVYRPDRAVTP